MPLGGLGGGGGSDLGGGIGGAIGGIAGLLLAGKGGKGEYEKAVKAWEALKAVDFDMTKLSPELQQVVGTMAGQDYQAQIGGPVSLTQDSPGAREAQLQALSGMQNFAQTGTDQESQLAAIEAQRAMGQQQQRSLGSMMQNLQARGRMGGGAEIAARNAAGQQSAEMGRGMGSDIVRNAIASRMAAIQGQGQMAGQLRAQDIGLSGEQAGQRNSFNEWLSRLKTDAAFRTGDSRAQAQQFNIQNRQGISNANMANTQAMRIRNQEYPNQMRQQGYENQVTRASGLSNALSQFGQAKYAEQAARMKNMQSAGQGIGGAAGGLYGI